MSPKLDCRSNKLTLCLRLFSNTFLSHANHLPRINLNLWALEISRQICHTQIRNSIKPTTTDFNQNKFIPCGSLPRVSISFNSEMTMTFLCCGSRSLVDPRYSIDGTELKQFVVSRMEKRIKRRLGILWMRA